MHPLFWVGVGLLFLGLFIKLVVNLAELILGRKQNRNNLNPGGGYTPGPLRPKSWTPKANQYKIYWQDELDLKIIERAKELAERDKLVEIDEKTMKQAILDVVHQEMIRLSDRRN